MIASLFFIGWRIATKGEYERRELAQCEALAVSAAFAVCEALDAPELAAYVQANGATEFVIDHMKMPGHNVVSVTITPEAEGFSVLRARGDELELAQPAESRIHRQKN